MNTKLNRIIDIVGAEPATFTEIGDAMVTCINHNYPGTLKGIEIDLNYSPAVSNSHSCPHNGTTNWGGKKKDAPTSYQGLRGRISFRIANNKEHKSGIFDSLQMYTGTGGSGGDRDGPWQSVNKKAYSLITGSSCVGFKKYQPKIFTYDCNMFLDDWPEFQKLIEKERVFSILKHGDASLLNSKTFKYSWIDPEYAALDEHIINLSNSFNSNRKIIGVVGLIGSGKSTASSYLTNNYNFKEYAFADRVKSVVSAIFGWPANMIAGITQESREWREQVDEWWSNRLGIPNFTPRRALQLIGTNVMRNHFNDDIWVASLEKRLLDQERDVIISDVRFPNEIEMIKQLGGTIIRIKRDDPDWVSGGETLSIRSDIHPSEYSWIGCDIDYTIDNDGTKADLYKKLDSFYEDLILSKK